MKLKNTTGPLILAMSLIAGCSSGQQGRNPQTGDRTKAGWITLFDGSSTDAWRSTVSDSFPKEGWKVKGDELIVLGPTDSTYAGTDIITKKEYSNFEFELEYKLSPHGNTGVKYFVVDTFPGHQGDYLGMEFQMLDDPDYTTEELGNNLGNHYTGSLYDLIPAPSQKIMHPAGQWNSIRIVSDGHHVEHWLNGQKILQYERGSDCFEALVARSKYSDLKGFGEMAAGHIMLQGHNSEAAFRNIRIKSW